MLASEGTYAIAGMNNNVYLFSFFTGTTLKEFEAHDDQITAILYKNQIVVTVSIDQMIKLWNFKDQDPTSSV